MSWLVTAGNTLAPIDKVRAITNIFTGRTGARLAWHAHEQGESVTLLTSHPEAIYTWAERDSLTKSSRWRQFTYTTFAELQTLLAKYVRESPPGVCVHCAAVNDYETAAVYAPAAQTHFSPDTQAWQAASGEPTLIEQKSGKIKSSSPELWLRLVRTPKLIDMMRKEWGYTGLLVKFKLEVDMSADALLAGAEAARLQSQADLLVANTLETVQQWAWVGPIAQQYIRVSRDELPGALYQAVTQLQRGNRDG